MTDWIVSRLSHLEFIIITGFMYFFIVSFIVFIFIDLRLEVLMRINFSKCFLQNSWYLIIIINLIVMIYDCIIENIFIYKYSEVIIIPLFDLMWDTTKPIKDANFQKL